MGLFAFIFHSAADATNSGHIANRCSMPMLCDSVWCYKCGKGHNAQDHDILCPRAKLHKTHWHLRLRATLYESQREMALCHRRILQSTECLSHPHARLHRRRSPFLTDLVKILWVNVRRSNPRLRAILNSNKHADLILVQEPWYDKIGTVRSDFEPEGTDTLGTITDPLWDTLYPKFNPGERCKVVAYRRISSTTFTITKQTGPRVHYHTMTIDVHTDNESVVSSVASNLSSMSRSADICHSTHTRENHGHIAMSWLNVPMANHTSPCCGPENISPSRTQAPRTTGTVRTSLFIYRGPAA